MIPVIDKSVPYFDVIMVRPKDAPPVQVPVLPQGYAYRAHRLGDDTAWSAIEASVDEFDTPEQALAHYQKEFAPHEAEMARRTVYVVSPQGVPVANASAWWKQDDTLGEVAMLHWVAAMPQEQGKGLGRAVTCKALSRFETLGPHTDIWLTTQTWSHVAIGLYLSLGFCAHKTYMLAGHKNGYDGAVPVLEKIMPPEVFARFVETAVD